MANMEVKEWAWKEATAPAQPTPKARQLLECDQLSTELIPSVIPVKPVALHFGLTQLNNTRVTFHSFLAFPHTVFLS